MQIIYILLYKINIKFMKKEISPEEFKALALRPSVVENRKEEFLEKVKTFLSRPDLSELLISEKLSDCPFIVIGMTIEGHLAHGLGFSFFVANGYTPLGQDFPVRRNSNHCKLIIANCYEIKKQEDSSLKLEYLFNDEDVLESDVVENIFDKIISNRNGIFITPLRLAKFTLADCYVPLLCWCQCFEDRNNGELYYLMCDVDAACLYIMQEADFKKEKESLCVEEIPFKTKKISSSFSSYFFNGYTLVRNEESRVNGGVGVFFS